MNEHRYTRLLGRTVELRDNNSDKQMWEDTFLLGYNTPPKGMPAPKTVLDLGANIGLTAAYYAELWRDALIWMVEPHPANLKLAHANAPNCVPILFAVACRAGWYSLDEAQTPSAYRLYGNGTTVQAVTIHTLIDALGGHVDFVKMDIEGEEWHILRTPFEASHLMVEFHDPADNYARALEAGLELLAATGWEAQHYPTHHPAAVYATR